MSSPYRIRRIQYALVCVPACFLLHVFAHACMTGIGSGRSVRYREDAHAEGERITCKYVEVICLLRVNHNDGERVTRKHFSAPSSKSSRFVHNRVRAEEKVFDHVVFCRSQNRRASSEAPTMTQSSTETHRSTVSTGHSARLPYLKPSFYFFFLEDFNLLHQNII